MIRLIRGSVFDSKCDLIIIPCDRYGGIASFFESELSVREMPVVRKPVIAGDILFIENTGNFSNASYIGYAASVDATWHSSCVDFIRTISLQILEYCQEQMIIKVNVPLLGTGAGGLSARDSYNTMQEIFEFVPNVMLCVYAFQEEKYNELSDKKKVTSKPNIPIKNPRVFISYTDGDGSNRNWVKKFACKLRTSGVDARLDMFHLRPGQDLPQWMANEIIMADKVVLICDKFYANKADSRKGGVGWETMIIQGDMLSNQEQNKYVTILRDSDIDSSLPVYAKSKYALNWAKEEITEEDFNELLLNLFDCDLAPPIGEVPLFIQEKLSEQSKW